MKAILRNSIAELRTLNYSYACIGEKLSISPNTIKSFCRRYHIAPRDVYKTKAEKERLEVCKYCGKMLIQSSCQHKTFCDDRCRFEYWKAQRRKS